MNPDQSSDPQGLSPISRRAFFEGMGTGALKLGLLGAAAASFGNDGNCNISVIPGLGGGRCGYCDGPAQDYDHCDGSYCNYANYGDTAYGDSTNCGYCEAPGQDYEHCDGDYCDYTNYADNGGIPYADSGSCGYCEAPGQDYEHCDGDYCDYTNYADA